MVYQSVVELIGNTPLLRLHRIEGRFSLACQLYAKLEKQNPAGSSKDRAVKQMIEDYLAEGQLATGSLIIEATSGNTGIALASLADYYGFRAIIVMPKSMSEQRKDLIRAYGAELVLVDGPMGSAIKTAEKLRTENPGSISLSQFDNPSNVKAHYLSTGPELHKDVPDLDFILAGIGSGGTISGIGKYYKENNLKAKIIGLEPASSPFLSQGRAGAHQIEGIGAGFRPKNYLSQYVDEIRTVTDEEALKMARLIVKEEGILVGISSGAALAGSLDLIKEKGLKGRKIAMVWPDTGERYSWN